MSTAVYAGTFDPITAGHFSVIRQAVKLFSHLRILIAVNPDKQTLFTAAERLAMIREVVAILPNVSVDHTERYVVEYARDIGATFLVRGIRGASDVQMEMELARMNRSIAPEISTILLPAEAHLSSVSSSDLKDRIRRGEDIADYCPPAIAERVRQALLARIEGAVKEAA